MDRPSHELRTSMRGNSSQMAPRRIGGIAVAVIAEGAVAALLILGMATGAIEKKLEDLTTTVEQQQVEDKPPPPPPPDVVKPPPPFVPPPDIAIAVEAPASNANTITATSVQQPPRPATPPAPPAPPPPAPTKLEAIMSTRVQKPPYPAISQRMGEQGTTEMIVTIDTSGSVTACQVIKTSGSKRLDDAACAHATARYKWKPPTQEGKPVEARTQINVVWSLLDAK
jgi:periplasmic protein TonB